MSKKRVAVLGSTGSIGRQTLDVLRSYPDLFELTAITANSNGELLQNQKDEFNVKYSGLSCVDDRVLSEAVVEADVVVVATAGISALEAILLAIENGVDVALANKESLVAGGRLILDKLENSSSKLLPVDSEHSAIWQCIDGKQEYADRLILTASGGAFFGYNKKRLLGVTKEQALKHPSWSMGKKITVDSATMMNKGFEIIEAAYLFNFPQSKIDVVVHPQSVVHSMVEFVDGTVMANLGIPDMRTPILYALTYPKRVKTDAKRLNLSAMDLHFYPCDTDTFTTVSMARNALINGNPCAPLILCAADDAAVKAFLEDRIGFYDIFGVLEAVVAKYGSPYARTAKDIKAVYQDVLNFTESIIASNAVKK